MKKFLTMAALIVLAAMTLTSCGDDEPKQTNTTATYKMTFSQDLLDVFDVYLVYKGYNGKNVPEAVNVINWSKNASCDKLPAEYGVKYIFTPKEGVTLTKEKYDLKAHFDIDITKSAGGGYHQQIVISNAGGLKKEKVLEYMEKLSGKSIGFRVSKDGGINPDNDMNYDI